MRVAVIGHHEWVTFMRVPQMPAPGEIVHSTEWWEQPGGGGANAAVQLAKLAGDCLLFTAFGDDEIGRRAERELKELGVTVASVVRPEQTRRAVTHLDDQGERTITVLGERLAPQSSDPLPWTELDTMDAVYFTAGDVGALRHARRAGVVVATARVLPVLVEAGVRLDALVSSAVDRSESYERGWVRPEPEVVVRTEGGSGGVYTLADGTTGRYDAVPTDDVVDRYGAGDSFAAGFAFGLGAGRALDDALHLAARCGAAVVAGRGPHDGQLRASDL